MLKLDPPLHKFVDLSLLFFLNLYFIFVIIFTSFFLKALVAPAIRDGCLAASQGGKATPLLPATVTMGVATAQRLTAETRVSAPRARTAWKVGRSQTSRVFIALNGREMIGVQLANDGCSSRMWGKTKFNT